MTTLLAHGRRLRYEPQRLQNCLAKATQAETKVVQRLSKLEPALKRSVSQDHPKTSPPPSQEPSKTSPAPPASKHRQRELKPDLSDVSLDSLGFPRMLKDVETPTPSHAQPGSEEDKQADVEAPMICPKKKRLDFDGLQQKLLAEAQDSCHKFPERHCAEM